ncbi:hypothetical protein VTI74DRAFT_10124 [Chaetomium olivicolor]
MARISRIFRKARGLLSLSGQPKGLDGLGQKERTDQPASSPIDGQSSEGRTAPIRFFLATKVILFSSIVNVLLVFVPVGIAVRVIFAMNAIAIVPLAGLLSHATEVVASRLGDAVGALMNVTFGNAVELIIFIIALVQNHIRIVQASLVGSILVNLLLILGMCFLFGGLRFREQIYNSTVTQMSACLLALSVTSLLLPTAFHASFSSESKADYRVLQVSRGTSVIILVVYFLYLVFQLKSHSYIYASTPQDVLERETAPGPAAQYLNPSPSEASSTESDSDGSSHSSSTAGKIREMVRRGKMKDEIAIGDGETNPDLEAVVATPVSSTSAGLGSLDDFDATKLPRGTTTDEVGEPAYCPVRRVRHHRMNHGRGSRRGTKAEPRGAPEPPKRLPDQPQNETRRLNFVAAPDLEAQPRTTRPRPFSMLSVRTSLGARPLNPMATTPTQPGIQRAKTEPARRAEGHRGRDPTMPPLIPIPVYSHSQPSRSASQRRPDANAEPQQQEGDGPKPHPVSRTTAILILLVSTALVAVCAEFMVSSIHELVATETGLSEAFIGLILLPLVGNAAEHVTAVSVAWKNKMDLAIGVAVGSSIQIALFVTPLVVILGWVLGKDLSLYFTIFETVCVFVSAFIVNFLVLDGRSNYLEGALLCAAYVIIAVAAFFYPHVQAANLLGGGDD